MNKEEFLKTLEKKLSILNEKERNDIINEYRDTISEKVKHGQTEKEAVSDFGDLDELVSGILDAYKINPDYNKEKSFTLEGEKLIKKGASKLADLTRDFADNIKNNDTEKNLNLAFEIIIKVFLTLILLAIITVPLKFFQELGFAFAETFFEPFSFIIKIIIFILFIALYLSLGLLIISNLFKQYFVKEEKDSEENIKKKQPPKKTVKNNKTTIASVFLLILKIGVVILILFPLFCIDIALTLGLILSIFYWIKGIDLFGLTLLLFGISTLFIWFTLLIFNITFSKGKITIIPFFLGLIITVFGGLFFIDMVTNIEYINEVPKSYNKNTISKKFETDKNVYINSYLNGKITKTIDNKLKNDEIILNITYFKNNSIDIYNEPEYILPNEICDDQTCDKTYNYISLDYDYTDDYNHNKKRFNEFIKNLKDNKIYNYSKLSEVNVEIRANEKKMSLIEIG